MDDIACPKCRSNLYSQSRTGYACMACGYREKVEREVFRGPSPEREGRAYALQDWLEQTSWRQSKALWARASPKPPKTRDGVTRVQRRLMNEKFCRAKMFLSRYDATHDLSDLVTAEALVNDLLRHQSAAERPALLHGLQKAIREKRLKNG